MKYLIKLFCLLGFIPIFAQTFTLQELEMYAKYDFETFSRKVMSKGYEFYSSVDIITFRYTESTVNNIYLINYTNDGILYTTTYKSSYTNLVNSIKERKYTYITSTKEGNNQVCSHYQNDNYVISTCIASIETEYYEKPSISFYEVHILPIIN